MGLWAYLWKIILIVLIEVASPAHRGWHHPLAGTLTWINGEKGLNSALCSLLSDCRCGVTRCFKFPLPQLSCTMGYDLELR